LPYTATFGCIDCGGASEQTVATLMPQIPLPESAAVSVILTSGITDLSGNAIAAQTTTFQTMAGSDFSAPSLYDVVGNRPPGFATPTYSLPRR
jgi:hypothetical protein